MPIKPSFSWQETELSLEVIVSLPGASRSKSDVFATECLLKVNLSPYLLVLDLYEEVESSRTVATFVGNEGVTFKLFKKEPGLWGQLEAEGSKEQLTARRNASIERAHEQAEQARKERLQRKQAEERAAVDRRIEMERKRRQMLEAAKQAELTAERDRLATWKKQIGGSGSDGTALQQLAGTGDESDYESDGEGEGAHRESQQAAMPDNPYYHGKKWQPNHQQNRTIKQKAIDDESDDDELAADTSSTDPAHSKGLDSGSSNSSSTLHPVASSDGSCAGLLEADSCTGSKFEPVQDSWQPLPPPRMRAEAVKVEFTPLEMPNLPAREQREEELRVYKKQQAAVQQGTMADSADVADRQPLFLKDKGDALFAQGNYSGALAAYTRAIEVGGAIPALWSNRAAAYAKLGQHPQAIEDCDVALQMLRQRQTRCEEGVMSDSEAAALRKQLARVLARRAAAYTALGQLQPALTDFEEAVKYEPSNTRLAADADELRAALQHPIGSSTHDKQYDAGAAAAAAAEGLKARGAARFAAGDYAGAVEAFHVLLALPTPAQLSGLERIAGHSNRAAAYLALGDFTAAEADCCAGIAAALKQLYQQQLDQQQHSPAQHQNSAVQGNCTELQHKADDQGEQKQDLCSGCGPHVSSTGHAESAADALAEAATAASHAWAAHRSTTDSSSMNGITQSSVTGSETGCNRADAEAASHKLQLWVAAVATCAQPDSSSSSSTLPAVCVNSSSHTGIGSSTHMISVESSAHTGMDSNTQTLLACIGRLLSRRGAAYGHLKQYQQAAQDFESGAMLLEAAGAADKAAALRTDAAHMQGMTS